MEKKTVKKAAPKKKTVASKKTESPSPFYELAADVTAPPVAARSTRPKAGKKTAAAPKAAATTVSEPPVIKGESTPSTKSTAAKKKAAPKKTTKKVAADLTAEIVPAGPDADLSPAAKTLAEPTLPELARENRARLMMQTPTRVQFYWSLKENPYHQFHKAFGADAGSYLLVSKLTDLKRGTEEIHPAEDEGNWWYAVEPGRKYRAEIGFYAPNRPYVRIVYSNTIETPRRAPSPHAASEASWRIPAHKFAEVLEHAGFSQDAFDVALAGDDHEAAQNTTHTAFKDFIGANGFDLSGIPAEDIRYSLSALAAGLNIADLRSRISPALFAILQANARNLAADKAMSALTEFFDVDETEFPEQRYSSAVYGASLVNFPRTLKRKFAPVSSHSLR